MLTLGVVGVGIRWQLPVRIGNSGRGRVCPRRVSVLTEPLLRPGRLRKAWHRTVVRPRPAHGSIWRSVALLLRRRHRRPLVLSTGSEGCLLKHGYEMDSQLACRDTVG